MRNFIIRGGTALAALALLAGCSSGGSSSRGGDNEGGTSDTVKTQSLANGEMPTDGPPQDGGTITMQDATDASTLDIHKSAAAAGFSAVVGTVYSTLLAFDTGPDVPYGSTVSVHGDLAESWGSLG